MYLGSSPRHHTAVIAAVDAAKDPTKIVESCRIVQGWINNPHRPTMTDDVIRELIKAATGQVLLEALKVIDKTNDVRFIDCFQSKVRNAESSADVGLVLRKLDGLARMGLFNDAIADRLLADGSEQMPDTKAIQTQKPEILKRVQEKSASGQAIA